MGDPDCKAEALRLKSALEKADQENSLSGVCDVLQALLALPGVTEAVIKETKLGKVLAGFKKKYDAEDPSLGKLIMDVLKHWTRIAKQAKSKRLAAAGTVEGTSSTAASGSTTTTSDSSSSSAANLKNSQSNADLATLIDLAGPPTAQRVKMAAVLVRALSLPLPAAEAGAGAEASESKANRSAESLPSAAGIEALATGIEASCFVAHPCDASGKQADYTAKIRTLNFNIKKNDMLRAHVLQAHVPVAKLLSMSADDMAGERLLQQRALQLEEEEESRRQDWCALHEAGIIKAAADAGGLKVSREIFNFAGEEEEVSDDD